MRPHPPIRATPDDEQTGERVLRELVRRIVAEADPLRIVLFGSRAKGAARTDSDFDLLVVMPEGTPCRQVAMRLYPATRGLGVSKDFLVATPSVLERHRNNRGLIYREILRTGREVYARSDESTR